MAVPKKRKSKKKKNIRKRYWKNKARSIQQKALFYGLKILSKP